jgi:nucleoid-associated protein YgaU
VAIIVAIGLSIWTARRDEAPTPPQQQAAPSAPAPNTAANAPKTGDQQTNKPAEAPKAADAAPSFDVVRIGRDGHTVMAGRAAPGADVVIMDGDKELGRTKANDQGEWVYTPDQPLTPGNRELSLKANNPNGQSKTGDAPVVLIVPEHSKTAGEPGGGGEAVAIKVKPGGGVQILQVPISKEGSGPVSVDVVDFDEKGRLSISGHALPKATVQIYLDNGSIGTATADEKGNWSLTVDHPLSDGSHTVRADQVAAGGKVTARAEITFTAGAGGATSGRITVATGNSLWRIARKAYGSGFNYTTIYQANKEQIRNPDLIYPGQVFKLPTKG